MTFSLIAAFVIVALTFVLLGTVLVAALIRRIVGVREDQP